MIVGYLVAFLLLAGWVWLSVHLLIWSLRYAGHIWAAWRLLVPRGGRRSY